jgi:TPP-dependent pyruvate/acetoin dehydrogenase alpha subunit
MGKQTHSVKKTERQVPARKTPVTVTADEQLRMYEYMQMMREFEESILRLYQQGRIVGGAYSGRGNEATAVGSAFALGTNDYLFPMHRDIGAHFVKGQSIRALMLQHLARGESLTRGRDGTGHYTDPALRIYGNISHLGAMIPVACGVALASALRKTGEVVMTYIGDGGASVGEVHEGLMMASTMRLPLILIIENNQYAYSTPVEKQFAAKNLSDRALGYGIPGFTIDGTDILEVYSRCREAVKRAREGKGPTIIECVTMRMSGHAAHDNAWYVPKKLMEEWKKKDPIERFEQHLMKSRILTPGAQKSMLKNIRAAIEAEAAYADAQPYPSGEEATDGVLAE